MNEDLRKYYEYLKTSGADVPPTYDSFANTLSNEADARKYYDYVKEKGFDAPDTYESFSNTFGLKKKVPSIQDTGVLLEGLSKGVSQTTSPSSQLKSEQKSLGSESEFDIDSHFGDFIGGVVKEKEQLRKKVYDEQATIVVDPETGETSYSIGRTPEAKSAIKQLTGIPEVFQRESQIVENNPNPQYEGSLLFNGYNKEIQLPINKGIDYWHEASAVEMPKESFSLFGSTNPSDVKELPSDMRKVLADYESTLKNTDPDKYNELQTISKYSGQTLDYSDVYEYDSEYNRDFIKDEFQPIKQFLKVEGDKVKVIKPSEKDEADFLLSALENQGKLVTADFLSKTKQGEEDVDYGDGTTAFSRYKDALKGLNSIYEEIRYNSKYSGKLLEEEINREVRELRQKQADKRYEEMYKYSPTLATATYALGEAGRAFMSVPRKIFSMPEIVGIEIPELQAKANEAKKTEQSYLPKATELQKSILDRPLNIITTGSEMIADVYLMGKGGALMGGSRPAYFASSVVNTYNDYRDATYDKLIAEGVPEAKAREAADANAFFGSMFTGLVESAFPGMERMIAGGVKKDAAESLVASLNKGATVKDAMKEATKTYFKEMPKEQVEELTNLLTDKMVNAQTNYQIGHNYLDADIHAGEIAETMLMTGVITGFASMKDIKMPNGLQRAALYEAVSDRKSFDEKLQKTVESGAISKEDAAVITQNLDELQEVIKGLPDVKLDDKKGMDLIMALYQKKKVKESDKGAYVDEKFAPQKEEAIAKKVAGLDTQIDEIIKTEKDDSANRKEQVSGEIGERKELKQTESVVETGKEAVSNSGILQEEKPEVDKEYDIEDGHHRYIAYKEAGIKEVPVKGIEGVEMVSIEKLRPTEVLEEKDRTIIEGIKESISKGEVIEPIEIKEEVKIEDVRPETEEDAVRWDKKVLGKLDQWEKNLDEFSKGTLGINIPVVIGKGAIKAMKGVVKTAGSVQNIVQAGIDYVKSTDWYNSLNEEGKREAEAEVSYQFSRPMGVAKKAGKEKAYSNRKAIKKMARSKSTLASDRDIFKAFASINPNQVDDIDKYIEVSNAIRQTRKERTLTNEDIEKYIQDAINKQNNKEVERIIKENPEMVESGFINDKMSLREVQYAMTGYKLVADPEGDERIERLESKQEIKEQKRKTLTSQIESKVDVINKEIEPDTEMQKEVVSALNNINLDLVSPEMLNLINQVTDNIIANDSYSRAGEIIIETKIQEAIKEASFRLGELGYDSFQDFVEDEANKLQKLYKYAKEKGFNTSQITGAIEQYDELKGMLRNITDMQGIFSGHANVIEEVNEFNKRLDKKLNKNNRGFEEQIRMQMYSAVSQNYGGEDVDNQIDFDIAKSRLFSSIQNRVIDIAERVRSKHRGKKGSVRKKQKFTEEQKEDVIKRVRGATTISELRDIISEIPNATSKRTLVVPLDVYEKIIEKSTNADEVISKLNKDERDLVDFMRLEFKKHKESLFEISEMYDNNIPDNVNNYLPLVYEKTSMASKVGSKKSLEEDITANRFIGNLLNKAPSGTTINRNKSKNIGEDKQLSLNFLYDMTRKYREMLYQVHTMPSRRTFDKIIRDKDFENILGKDNARILSEYITKNVQTQLNISESDPLYLQVANIFSRVGMGGSRMALGNILFGRMNQTASVMMGTLVKGAGKGSVKWLYTSPRKPNKNLFKHSNLKEAMQTGAGYRPDYYVNEQKALDTSNKIVSGAKRILVDVPDMVTQYLNDATLSQVGKGDRIARRRTWMYYYREYRVFRDKEKNFKWKDEYNNPSKSASAYADQQVESTQSANTFSALPVILTKGRNFGAVIKNMYVGFQTFAIATRARLISDVEKFNKGFWSMNSKLMGEALQDISATMIEFTVFSSLKVAQGAFLTMLTIPFVAWLLGIGDDEAEELVPQITWEQAMERVGGSVARDMLFSGIPLADNPGASFINWSYKQLTDKDKNILYQKGDDEGQWYDGFGTYSPFVGSWVNARETYMKLNYGVPELEKGGLESKSEIGTRQLNERERKLYTLLMVYDVLRISGISEQNVSKIAEKLRRIAEKEHTIGEAKILYDPNKKKEEEKSSGRSPRQSNRSSSQRRGSSRR